MNKSELAERLAGRTGMSKAAAKDAVDGVFEAIGDALANGDEARILGFGTFGTRNRPAHTARNPRKGESVSIAASTVPVLRTSGATGGLDFECVRLHHDDGRPRWNLPSVLRIAEKQWIALGSLGSAHAAQQNKQKRSPTRIRCRQGHPLSFGMGY